MTETYQSQNMQSALDGCGCKGECQVDGPEQNGADSSLGRDLMKLLPGAVLFALGLGVEYLMPWTPAWLGPGVFWAAYILAGWSVLAMGLRSLLTRGLLDEFVLMSLATVGALAIGAYAEAVAVMLFYRVGETFQDSAVRRSRQSVASLLQLRPDMARVVDAHDGVAIRDPAQVQVGQTIQIHPGERVPLDGTVLTGQSRADTSALTGESHPRTLSPGDGILSGMVNLSGLLTVRVDKPLAQSTVSVILDLVQNAAQRKAPTEQFMTRVARVYTPIVVGLAALIAFGPIVAFHLPGLQSLFTAPPEMTDWVYRGLVFLVISCPCALVISIPLGFFAGIGAGSRQGILIKGANFLEALSRVRTVVWDKTGTLTYGRFAVHSVHPEEGYSREDVLSWAAAAEEYSSHPVARAIVREHRGQRTEDRGQRAEDRGQRTEDRGQKTEDRGQEEEKNAGMLGCWDAGMLESRSEAEITPWGDWDDGNLESGRSLKSEESGRKDGGVEVREFSGQGVQALIRGREVLVGTEDFLRSQGAAKLHWNIPGGGVGVAVDQKAAGWIQVQDQIRFQSSQAVEGLKHLGVAQYMLTGDSREVAEGIGSLLGLDGVKAELMPQDKVAELEAIMVRNQGRGYTAFVGDGINDAPVLARSDIGVAMGGLGSDAAIEAADVVLMEDDPGKLVQAVSLGGRTRTIVWQNIGLALGIKVLVMGLGALGLASMWAAVFADVGVALLAVGNSLRILR
ncbi:MAG: heavy metal translocating P-type ATPase [Desulfovermiculus sp.]|nr:heavy metal translocating P-type ATPase [Desulfovermiculus sp.]